jgi:hypothetical protein
MGESVLRVEELQLDRGGRMVLRLRGRLAHRKGNGSRFPYPATEIRCPVLAAGPRAVTQWCWEKAGGSPGKSYLFFVRSEYPGIG